MFLFPQDKKMSRFMKITCRPFWSKTTEMKLEFLNVLKYFLLKLEGVDMCLLVEDCVINTHKRHKSNTTNKMKI